MALADRERLRGDSSGVGGVLPDSSLSPRRRPADLGQAAGLSRCRPSFTSFAPMAMVQAPDRRTLGARARPPSSCSRRSMESSSLELRAETHLSSACRRCSPMGHLAASYVGWVISRDGESPRRVFYGNGTVV